MSLVQELTRMTPDVQKSLLSRPGFVTHWNKERTGEKPIATERRSSCKKTNGFTKLQQDTLDFLRQFKAARASDIATEIGSSNTGAHEVLKKLRSLGLVEKDQRSKMYYLAGKKPKAFIKPTITDEILHLIKTSETFQTKELVKITSWSPVYLVKLKQKGLITSVRRGVWKWIGGDQ